MRLSPLIAALGLLLVSAPALADTPVITSNASRASGNLSGTIAVTNTFQSVQVKTTPRQGCFIQNNGTHNMWVFFGDIAGATAGKSAVLAAGGSLNCSNSGISATDQISITGTSGDAFAAMIDGAPQLAGAGGSSASTVVTQGTSPWVVDDATGANFASVVSAVNAAALTPGAALIGGTSTDRSTTITLGGTAQTIAGGTYANGWEVCNPDATEDAWASDSTTAAANGTGSHRIALNGGCYSPPSGSKPIASLSVIAATTSHKLTIRSW